MQSKEAGSRFRGRPDEKTIQYSYYSAPRKQS